MGQPFLTPALGNWSGQIHDTAVLPQGKEGTILNERKLGRPQRLTGHFREVPAVLRRYMAGTRYFLNKYILLPEDGVSMIPSSEWKTVQKSRSEFGHLYFFLM
jgi:hypothetical protein